MKKTLILSLALVGFVAAGCAEEPADTVDTTIIEPAPVVTEPTDDMLLDTTGMMDEGAMMDDTTGMMADTTAM